LDVNGEKNIGFCNVEIVAHGPFAITGFCQFYYCRVPSCLATLRLQRWYAASLHPSLAKGKLPNRLRLAQRMGGVWIDFLSSFALSWLARCWCSSACQREAWQKSGAFHW
jgi:hypothetical protein